MKVEVLQGEYLDVNVYIVGDDKHCFIIDCGAKLKEVQVAIKGRIVEGILLTHSHYDHSIYANEYAKFFKAKVYMSARGEEIIKDPKKNGEEFFNGENSKSEVLSNIDFSKFTLLTGDGKIKLPNFEIEYFATPGHSPCSICYKVKGILFAGDTIFDRSIGRIDLYASDKNEMIESLKKLDNINFDICFSGHGNSSTIEEQKRNIRISLRFLQR